MCGWTRERRRGRFDVGRELGRVEAALRRLELEGPDAAHQLAAPVARHPGRRDQAGLPVDVEFGGTREAEVAVRDVDGFLVGLASAGEERRAQLEDAMRLVTAASDGGGDGDVAGRAVHAAERVAGDAAGRRVERRHDHPRVEAAGQRHGDGLAAAEARPTACCSRSEKPSTKSVSETASSPSSSAGSKVRLRRQPLRVEREARARRQHLDVAEDGTCPECGTARHQFGEAGRIERSCPRRHCEDCLGLGCEVGRRSVDVDEDPLAAVAVVEEEGPSKRGIGDEAGAGRGESSGHRVHGGVAANHCHERRTIGSTFTGHDHDWHPCACRGVPEDRRRETHVAGDGAGRPARDHRLARTDRSVMAAAIRRTTSDELPQASLGLDRRAVHDTEEPRHVRRLLCRASTLADRESPCDRSGHEVLDLRADAGHLFRRQAREHRQRQDLRWRPSR